MLALEDLVEAADRVLDLHVDPWRARELLRHVEGLGQEALDLAGPVDGHLVLIGQLVDAQDGDDVLELAVALEHLLHLIGHPEVLLPQDLGFEDRGGGVERVHRRIDALLRDRSRQGGGGVQVREGRGRRRVGEVVGRHVDGLNRGDRALPSRGDPLLKLAHLGFQRGLIADL